VGPRAVLDAVEMKLRNSKKKGKKDVMNNGREAVKK
jgi:hypothetical protein